VNILFFPRKVSIPDNLPESIKVLNFNINKEILIGGYYFLQDENLPSILLFHGNGEVALEYLYFRDLFFECGINLAVVDFRGYGHSTGKSDLDNLIKDGMPIYNEFTKWVSKNDLTPEKAETLQSFFYFPTWFDMLDAIFIVITTPEEAIRRDRKESLTKKFGDTTNPESIAKLPITTSMMGTPALVGVI